MVTARSNHISTAQHCKSSVLTINIWLA